jgi:spore germination cell wall hydrolase CwlJ-like protein
MLEFKFLWNAFKYYMRLLSSLVLMALAGLIIVPMSYASAITLQNAVEGELYTESSHPELYCLAMNTYFEAKSEPIAGQYATADVVLNRVNDARYPNTICEVVLQGPTRESWKTKQHADLPDDQRKYNPVRNMCQFSWYCDGKADKVRDGDAWRKAQEIAYRIVTEGKFRGVTEGATHYHATYVSPDWAPQLDLVGRIGTHIFYRWP